MVTRWFLFSLFLIFSPMVSVSAPALAECSHPQWAASVAEDARGSFGAICTDYAADNVLGPPDQAFVSLGDSAGSYVTVDMGASMLATGIRLRMLGTGPGGSTSEAFSVWISPDGASFDSVTAFPYEPEDPDPYDLPLSPPVHARYLRLRQEIDVAHGPTQCATYGADFDAVAFCTCEASVEVPSDGVFVYRDCELPLAVAVADACDLAAFQWDLLFDDARLAVAGVALGEFLGSTGRTVVELEPVVDAGRITYGAYSYGSAAGPEGAGTLATIDFTRSTQETADVDFTLENVELVDTMAGLIPAAVTGSTTAYLLAYIFGDFNESCEVTVADIMQVAARWGAVVGDPDYDPRYDVDLVEPGDYCASLPDGDIDVVDIQLVASQWLATCANPFVQVQPVPAAPDPVVLRCDPPSVSGEPGAAVAVDIVASGVADFGAWECILRFNPQRLAVEGVTPGDFLAATGNQAVGLDDPRGAGRHALGGFSWGHAPGPEGEGVVAHVTLRVLDCVDHADLALEAPQVTTTGAFALPDVGTVGGTIVCNASTAVAAGGVAPRPTRLRAAPNPFHARTTITFSMAAAGRTQVTIYDATGRTVRGLADRQFGAGIHSMAWNARDKSGQQVASGIYFVEVRTAEGAQRAKLLRID